MSRIDIVVPCYNYGRFLGRCVESVAEQAHREWRVLIIDDASTDDTSAVAAELAGRDQRVTFRRHAANHGHIATYNEGLDWAQGEYMLLLSADDFLLPGALDRAIAVLDADSEIGLVWGPSIDYHAGDPLPDAAPSASKTEVAVLDPIAFIRTLAASNCVPQSAAVVRTSVQKRFGGYLPELPHTGDIEMWVRFALHSKVAQVKAAQVAYRRHDSNMSLAYRGSANYEQFRKALGLHYPEIRERLRNGAAVEGWIRERFALWGLKLAKTSWKQGELDTCRRLIMAAFDELA
jgi:glycosyltransferase involved in cell wall biosynthesis